MLEDKETMKELKLSDTAENFVDGFVGVICPLCGEDYIFEIIDGDIDLYADFCGCPQKIKDELVDIIKEWLYEQV